MLVNLEIFISTLRELHDSASQTCAIFRDWYFMKPSKFIKKKLGKKYVIDIRIYNISGPGEKDPGKGVIE